MRTFFNFSPTSLMDKYLVNRFRSAGLVSKFVETDTDGTTMHCWVPKGRPAGHAEKPALVMLHGFGSTAVLAVVQADSCSPAFLRCICSGPSFLWAVILSEEREDGDIPEFNLLGTSYGGCVAFRMAHMFPAAIKRVIISNSGILMTPEDNVNLASRGHVNTVADLLLPASPKALLAASTLVFNRPLRLPHFLLQDFWSVLYTSNRKEKEELVQGVVLGTAHALPVPLLQQEVLVIWGEHDLIFPIDQAHELRRHLGEKAQLAVVKDAAHVPQLEQPKKFNGLVKAFLLH